MAFLTSECIFRSEMAGGVCHIRVDNARRGAVYQARNHGGVFLKMKWAFVVVFSVVEHAGRPPTVQWMDNSLKALNALSRAVFAACMGKFIRAGFADHAMSHALKRRDVTWTA